jgi:hypothetical protein
VNVNFEVARTRLASLGGQLLHASNDAYGAGIACLARAGPLGTRPGVSRLAEIRFRDLADGDDHAGLALGWEARGADRRLFPVLDADLTLTPAGPDAALLRLAGAYRAPLGALDAGLDRLMLRQVAESTIQDFLGRVADALDKGSRSAFGHQLGGALVVCQAT